MGDAEAHPPEHKRQRVEDDDVKRMFRAWAWKREHLPDKHRFQRPYMHKMVLVPEGEQVSLTIHQAKFEAEGFASTVWDSSIVLAKYCEKEAERFNGTRALDLSAGCGLVGVVLARLGAEVTATDLAPNLKLLRLNFEYNGAEAHVLEHRWGEDAAPLAPPFDVIVACDVMYIDEAVEPLVASLRALSGPHTRVLVAHGRNRGAEPHFLRTCEGAFHVRELGRDELHEVYQTVDVSVLELTPRHSGGGSVGVSSGRGIGGGGGDSGGVSSSGGDGGAGSAGRGGGASANGGSDAAPSRRDMRSSVDTCNNPPP